MTSQDKAAVRQVHRAQDDSTTSTNASIERIPTSASDSDVNEAIVRHLQTTGEDIGMT